MREIYQGLVSNPNNAIDNAQNMSITHTFGGTPVESKPLCVVTVTGEPGATVVGGGRFVEGTEITITAEVSDVELRFDGWYCDGKRISANNSYTFTVEKSCNIVAKVSPSGLKLIYQNTKDYTHYPFKIAYGTDLYNTLVSKIKVGDMLYLYYENDDDSNISKWWLCRLDSNWTNIDAEAGRTTDILPYGSGRIAINVRQEFLDAFEGPENGGLVILANTPGTGANLTLILSETV